ncbi:unnamed protein product [Urochloa decumbens]|uniref:F-box domain-containing protein n=1 Tax=Urochloa decumbens TaxID=240449 RepID=A0ABC9G9U8_9POAL
MPSSSSPATRGQRKKAQQRLPLKAFLSLQPPPERDWAELPLDLICYVFHHLGPVELLIGGAAGVCRSWCHAARDEPELWRHVDMRGYATRCIRSHVPIGALVRAAVRLGAGQCEAFWGDTGDDDLISFLAEQASSLKSLRLISCYNISKEGFAAEITKFSMLEELEISKCSGIVSSESLEAIAKSCPRLKHFRHIKRKHSSLSTGKKKDGEALAISGMHELRSLELYRNHLTNKGLTMILDNCVHLDLLIIRECPNVTMDGALLAKCARVMIVTLRGDHYAHYKASSSYYYNTSKSDDWGWYSDWDWGWDWGQCPTCDLFRTIRRMGDYEYFWYWGGHFFYEELQDYEDYSRYLNGVYVTDLDDEQETKIVAKSERRYLKINTGSI